MDYKEKYKLWLKDSYIDKETKLELMKIKDNNLEIKDRFSKNLEFGTGGVRALVGAGTNRINIYTVRMFSQGFCNYLLNKYYIDKDVKKMGICIAYDSRNMSKKFAIESALVFNANNIKSYIFSEEKPTPELSFAIRSLNCIGGVVITASHNTCDYNGYKVYDESGCQIYYPNDIELINYINKIYKFRDVNIMELDKAKKQGLYNIIGDDIEDEFLNCILNESINLYNLRKHCEDLKIVYSPLHGTGYKPISKVLKRAGFCSVYTVEEQKYPDGKFSTIKYPNPEDSEAFNFAIKLAKNVSADIILITDPDADRIGMAFKVRDGNYEILSGNLIASVMLEYILKEKIEKEAMDKKYAVISTIVSTKLTKDIAEHYNISYFEVLTGFKHVGELINRFELEKTYEYIFGFEESYGYLIGKNTRDKDSISAAVLLCEIGAYCKSRNLSFKDLINSIYDKYGFYKEDSCCIIVEGLNSQERIENVMDKLRNGNVIDIEEFKIKELRDYKKSIIYNFVTAEKKELHMQKSNILYYILYDNSWFCIRPSGTEPKLKFYFGVKQSKQNDISNELNIKNKLLNIIKKYL